jgi:hypothetical protein
MKRKCNTCNEEIPEGRLKAIPTTTKCIKCSDTNKVKAIIVTNGNTIEEVYETIQIIEDQTILKSISHINDMYARTLSDCIDLDVESDIEYDPRSAVRDAISNIETEEGLNNSMIVDSNILEITDNDFTDEITDISDEELKDDITEND